MVATRRGRSGITWGIIVLGVVLTSITGCNISSTYQGTPTASRAATPNTVPAPGLTQRGFLRTGDSHNVNSQSFANSVLAGDVIVVAITQFQGGVTSVSDSQTDTFTLVGAQLVNTSPATDYVELYYAKDVKGGITTVSVLFSESTDANVGIYEFSHLNTQSPLDRLATETDSSNMPNGGMITTTQSREVIFVVGVDDNGTDDAGHIVTPIAGSGYMLLDHIDDDQQYERFYDEYRTVPPGAYQTNFKVASNNADWGVIGASFKQ
jgi:hypothetical protein